MVTHWSQEVRSHHTSATGTSLATDPYKLSLLVYKCLHNAAPVYLSSDCVVCTGIIVGRETTTAFLCQWHPGQSADMNVLGRRARSECAALRRGTLCRQNCVLLLCAQTLSAKK